ncbi:YbjP/YqhG family protein [Sphingomonas sp. G124]|uniref:YbjP/YqhG family protein n=1 Tax=Sphingomonas cremea TaxID=2904799 RepID=A0A9X1QLX4_9SPHN|nr:DUF3828 domain-containing protein [Sphingomonas cremea]MCF2515525.1 YbjP/YqhG family protein [Sphingomonas cremea]
MIPIALLIAASAPVESPAAFVRRVYAGYSHSGYNPLTIPEQVFAPALTAAIQRDSSSGEVGYLDGDPLCDCQDYDRISAKILSIRQPNAYSADARIHVKLGPKEMRDLRLSLILTASGWRIADVVGADGHSLLKELQHSNAKR